MPLFDEALSDTNSYPELQDLYAEHGITAEKHMPFIIAFKELRKRICQHPTNYSDALLRHIGHLASTSNSNMGESMRATIDLSQFIGSTSR